MRAAPLRRTVMIGIVLVVCVVHAWLADRLLAGIASAEAQGRAPSRIEVAYVRELQPTAPASHAAGVAVPAPLPSQVSRAARVVKPDRAPAAAPAASRPVESAEVADADTDTDTDADGDADADAPSDVDASASPPSSAASAASLETADGQPAADAPATPFDAVSGEQADARSSEPSSGLAGEPVSEPASAAAAASGEAGVPSDSAASASTSSSTSPTESAPASAFSSASSTASSATAQPSTGASSATASKPFEWPESTRLSYTLTGNFRGEISGEARVEWVRDGARYQVHLDVVVGAPFAPLFTRRITSDGRITPRGLEPRLYFEESKMMFQSARRNTVRFDDNAVLLANANRLARPDGVQDSVSQFVQLTWLFSTRPQLLQPGLSIELPLALPRRLDLWTYDVMQPETLATPFGALDALHLKPRQVSPTASAAGSEGPTGAGSPGLASSALPGNALSVEMWFAPSLAYLPVRIRIHQSADTFIDLMISRLPQLAAPLK